MSSKCFQNKISYEKLWDNLTPVDIFSDMCRPYFFVICSLLVSFYFIHFLGDLIEILQMCKKIYICVKCLEDKINDMDLQRPNKTPDFDSNREITNKQPLNTLEELKEFDKSLNDKRQVFISYYEFVIFIFISFKNFRQIIWGELVAGIPKSWYLE